MITLLNIKISTILSIYMINLDILEKELRKFSNFRLLQKNQKIIDTIKNDTLLIIDSNIDYCELINNFCIKSVRNIKKIIKFSPSI